MQRLDSYDDLPQDMREYLSSNGWHFSKALCEWAVGRMKDLNGQPVSMADKATVDNLLSRYGMKVENDAGFDCVYVYHMLKSDFGDLMTPDDRLSKAIKRYLDDPDGYEGLALTRFFADCIGKGIPMPWDLI